MTVLKSKQQILLSDDGELPEGATEAAEQEFIVCQHCGEYLPTDGNPYCYGCGNWVTRSSSKEINRSPDPSLDPYRVVSGLVFLTFIVYSVCVFPITHVYTDKNPDFALIIFIALTVLVFTVTKRVWRFFHDRATT
jgi:hypothetical protein